MHGSCKKWKNISTSRSSLPPWRELTSRLWGIGEAFYIFTILRWTLFREWRKIPWCDYSFSTTEVLWVVFNWGLLWLMANPCSNLWPRKIITDSDSCSMDTYSILCPTRTRHAHETTLLCILWGLSIRCLVPLFTFPKIMAIFQRNTRPEQTFNANWSS